MNFAAVFSWPSTCPVKELTSILVTQSSLRVLQSSKNKLGMGSWGDTPSENQADINIPASSLSRETLKLFANDAFSPLLNLQFLEFSACRSLMISAQAVLHISKKCLLGSASMHAFSSPFLSAPSKPCGLFAHIPLKGE